MGSRTPGKYVWCPRCLADLSSPQCCTPAQLNRITTVPAKACGCLTGDLCDCPTPPEEHPVNIDQPGLYDLTDADYHRDPVPGGSLSSTGARKLLPPSCPALYRHWADNPQPPKAVFDFGHAAHREVLGVGAELVVVDAPNWRTKAAQEQRDEAHAAGRTPLLAAEYDQVQAMAAALRAHPLAGKLLEPGAGKAEQSAFWTDDETGMWCRARFDWLHRLAIVDYKTAASVEPGDLRRAVHNYGYHIQADFYLRGAKALDLGLDNFLFIAQMKEPPYLVTVFDLDPEDLAAAHAANRRALNLYRDCVKTNHWPSYADDVVQIARPAWANRTEEYVS